MGVSVGQYVVYDHLPGPTPSWRVTSTDLDTFHGEVGVHEVHEREEALTCPTGGTGCALHNEIHRVTSG